MNINHKFNDTIKNKIKEDIRKYLSPKHIPSQIFSVSEIPRTRSGKIVEILVKKLINGEKISNMESLANPDCLNEYQEIYKSLNSYA